MTTLSRGEQTMNLLGRTTPLGEGRAKRCPWWDYVWSVRTVIKVGSDGRVPIGTQRLRIEQPPQTKVVLCLHPSDHHSVLAPPPDPKQKPVLLFTNRPKSTFLV